MQNDRLSKYQIILKDEILDTLKVSRSLSDRGYSYDNAVDESLYHIIKTGFLETE